MGALRRAPHTSPPYPIPPLKHVPPEGGGGVGVPSRTHAHMRTRCAAMGSHHGARAHAMRRGCVRALLCVRVRSAMCSGSLGYAFGIRLGTVRDLFGFGSGSLWVRFGIRLGFVFKFIFFKISKTVLLCSLGAQRGTNHRQSQKSKIFFFFSPFQRKFFFFFPVFVKILTCQNFDTEHMFSMTSMSH